ncbi:protein DpdH [Gorillibacterium sp. sgz5001074]|uniref:protein DpdH n=1 Tax=Gorillibacterium sp. sgz5001074 TaxID=3446695 RepID=UPI003F67A6E3
MNPLVCWKPEQIHKVMDTDALHIQRHMFLATHHPIKMYKQTAGIKVQGKGSPYDETSFLHDFMAKKDYAFVPILGESGTGKSHLVRWLHAQIDPKNRRVLLIPRLSNLKDIILMILDGLEESIFEEYRQKILRSAGSVSLAQAKEMLHNSITYYIGPNGNHPVEQLDDYEQHFMENLPHLFRDPALYPVWFKEGGVIHQLADHIVGGNGGRLNERKEFSVEDLPLNLSFIDRASQDAISIYSDLAGDYELQQRAVEWINRNLDKAISSMLNLSNTDLIQLMSEVRMALARKGIELVLLIEDFTVLQGIDYQLLDALIYKPSSDAGGDKLCDMRVALGCTTGYFKRLEDTVITRIDFRVTLDVDEELVPPEEIERFAAKYLNAIRMPEDQISDWFLKSEKGNPLPSACAAIECPHMHQCHKAFGEVEGVGLYPFNRVALHTMYSRATKEENFNPRLLISKVLRHITENYADSILEGTFPSSTLFDHFGGRTNNRLTTMVKSEIERRDPVHHERRNTLIELWTEQFDVVDLHPFVHEAFSLDPLHVKGYGFDDQYTHTREKDKDKEKEKDPHVGVGTGDPGGLETDPQKPRVVQPSPQPVNELPQKTEELLRMVDSWVNEGIIPQKLTQDLRELVFDALNDFIQWDSERINGRWFIESRLWSNRSINFIRQSTQQGTGPILMLLPQTESEWKDTALALQGLIYFDHYKHWEFKQGTIFLRIVTRYLEKWSALLLEQMRNIPLTEGKWNPLPSTIEVLAITAAMSGLVDDTTVESLANALFNPLVEKNGKRSSEWDKVFGTLTNYREEIMNFASAQLAMVKGDYTKSVRLIDASKVVGQLSIMQLDHLIPTPEDKINTFDKLNRSADLLNKGLLKAIEAERQDKELWVKMVKQSLGDKIDVKCATNNLKKAYQASASSATLRDDPSKIQSSIAILESRPIADIVRRIESVIDKSPLETLVELGNLPINHITEIEDSIKVLTSFLENSTEKIEKDLSVLQQNEAVQQLEQVKSDINDQLNMIIQGLQSI